MDHSESPIYPVLEACLDRLDSAQFSIDTMLQSEFVKERYETFLMYSFRKYAGAQYHYSRIKEYLEKNATDHDEFFGNVLEKNDEIAAGSAHSPRITFKVRYDADHFVYELVAFLAALRSSVDFLAKVCGFYLRGISLDSMTTLKKLVEKGQINPVLAPIKNNVEWLKKLRDYRDHVVHRMIFPMSAGGEVHTVNGVTRRALYPVVIPESPPAYVPDTRATGQYEVEMDHVIGTSDAGMDSERMESWITKENGERMFDFSITYKPSFGYVSLEEFTRHHIESFEAFFVEVLEALMALEFQEFEC